jgi:dATP pyrophosphohydrolase
MKPVEYKRPESVLVVVCTSGGDVLMLQRQRPPGFWQSVTGSLERDETPLAAARRELLEETGLAVMVRDCHRSNEFPILPEWRARYAPGTEKNRDYVFIAECADRPEVTIDLREHQSFCWLPKQAAARRASSWTNRDAIRAYVP